MASCSLSASGVALSMSVLLTGCGGGGDDTAAEPAAVQSSGAPIQAAETACGLARFVEESLERVNGWRARGADCGTFGNLGPAPPLAWSNALAAAAAGHSADMARRNYFSHTSPEGATMVERVDAAGYRWSALAENIAAGQRTIQVVMDGWIDSDGHCANIMNPSLRDIGMACVATGSAAYRTYWTMDLGRAP
jgi:uncharacterized protein YkwD